MFQSIVLCTVSIVVTVLSKFAVVFAGFHTFNFSCFARWQTKAAAAVLAQEQVHVSQNKSW